MIKLFLEEIISSCNGISKLKDNIFFNNISIDSRKIKKGDLFIAIKGEKFNGHDFIEKALENGAIAVLCEKEIKNVPYIKVKNTKKALKDIAKLIIKKIDPIIIAITGSNGKTTTKEMISAVLETKYKLKKTIGNFNNEIGLPLSIFQLEENDEIFIAELGMNHKNEILDLVKIIKPRTVVITNVFNAHLKYFNSINEIADAKLEIINEHPETIILNGDIKILREKVKNIDNIEFFGLNNENNYKIKIIEHNENIFFKVFNKESVYNIKLNTPFLNMSYSAVISLIIGLKYNISVEKIKSSLYNFKPFSSRMEIIKGKIKIVNDCYNANPASMNSVISDIKYIDNRNRKVFIIGSMLELGKNSEKFHRELAKTIIKEAPELVYCVGDFAKWTFEELKKEKIKAYWYENSYKCAEEIISNIKNNDIILVKGSNGVKMNIITEKLKCLI